MQDWEIRVALDAPGLHSTRMSSSWNTKTALLLSLCPSESYGGIRSVIARIGTGRSPDGDAPLTEPALTGSEGEPPPPKGAILDRKQLEFLATKLVPPRCKGLIPRPRLLDMVSQLSGKKLGQDQGAGRVRQDVAGCGLVARTSTERKCGRVGDHRS